MASGYGPVTAGTPGVAASVNDYWSKQVVMVYVSTAARDADAVLTAALREGMVCYVTGTDRFYTYSGTAWVITGHTSSAGRVGGEWRRTANQAIATGTETSVSWDTDTNDPDSILPHHATTGTTATIAIGGTYAVTATVGWSANPGSTPYVYVQVGGSALVMNGAGDSASLSGTVSGTIPLVAGDTVIIRVFQNSGGSINLTGRFYLDRIGP